MPNTMRFLIIGAISFFALTSAHDAFAQTAPGSSALSATARGTIQSLNEEHPDWFILASS